MATKLAELTIDLRTVRKGKGRIAASHPVEQADLVVDLLLSFRGQAIDEIVDGLNAVPVPVIHGLHDGSLGAGVRQDARVMGARYGRFRTVRQSPSPAFQDGCWRPRRWVDTGETRSRHEPFENRLAKRSAEDVPIWCALGRLGTAERTAL